jgi:hypothetical protein
MENIDEWAEKLYAFANEEAKKVLHEFYEPTKTDIYPQVFHYLSTTNNQYTQILCLRCLMLGPEMKEPDWLTTLLRFVAGLKQRIQLVAFGQYSKLVISIINRLKKENQVEVVSQFSFSEPLDLYFWSECFADRQHIMDSDIVQTIIERLLPEVETNALQKLPLLLQFLKYPKQFHYRSSLDKIKEKVFETLGNIWTKGYKNAILILKCMKCILSYLRREHKVDEKDQIMVGNMCNFIGLIQSAETHKQICKVYNTMIKNETPEDSSVLEKELKIIDQFILATLQSKELTFQNFKWVRRLVHWRRLSNLEVYMAYSSFAMQWFEGPEDEKLSLNRFCSRHSLNSLSASNFQEWLRPMLSALIVEGDPRKISIFITYTTYSMVNQPMTKDFIDDVISMFGVYANGQRNYMMEFAFLTFFKHRTVDKGKKQGEFVTFFINYLINNFTVWRDNYKIVRKTMRCIVKIASANFITHFSLEQQMVLMNPNNFAVYLLDKKMKISYYKMVGSFCLLKTNRELLATLHGNMNLNDPTSIFPILTGFCMSNTPYSLDVLVKLITTHFLDFFRFCLITPSYITPCLKVLHLFSATLLNFYLSKKYILGLRFIQELFSQYLLTIGIPNGDDKYKQWFKPVYLALITLKNCLAITSSSTISMMFKSFGVFLFEKEILVMYDIIGRVKAEDFPREKVLTNVMNSFIAYSFNFKYVRMNWIPSQTIIPYLQKYIPSCLSWSSSVSYDSLIKIISKKHTNPYLQLILYELIGESHIKIFTWFCSNSNLDGFYTLVKKYPEFLNSWIISKIAKIPVEKTEEIIKYQKLQEEETLKDYNSFRKHFLTIQ